MSLIYAWYGDDFTGSTDVLESLAEGGVSAVLFLRAPDAPLLGRFDVQAIGLAGDSRSRSPQWMDAHLPAAFAALSSAPIVHYKTCSTFDSSPAVGSIGRAMEIGHAQFGGLVPIVVGAPHLGRHVAFGALFARAGDGVTYRIDRHPTMRRHPVTPMREADLRLHLKRQTWMPVGLVPLTALDAAGLAAVDDHPAVLFDGVRSDDLLAAGRLLLARGDVRFGVGSSGLTRALLAAWQAEGRVAAPDRLPVAPEVDRLLVVSGSCSPVTAAQIDWALGHGYAGLRVDLDDMSALADKAVAALDAGRSVVVYSAQGPAAAEALGEKLGTALGRAVAGIVPRARLRRVLFCGGDTSSHAVQQLGCDALTYVAPLERGVPLCRAHAADPRFDGLELALKGGQMGGADFFETARRGRPL